MGRKWAGMTADQRFESSFTRLGPSDCWEWTASRNDSGYGRIYVDGKQVRAHRYAWERVHGPIPHGLVIDHLCFNRACVNPSHMRTATRKQNTENRAGASSLNKSSGIRGVSWDKNKRKWMAHVTHMGRQIHLGRFEDIQEAARAAEAKRAELFNINQKVGV